MVDGPNIIDPTGLGRWSGVTLESSASKKLSILTAYRVCKGSPQSAPLGSSFLPEYEFFRESTDKSIFPRRQFLHDLQAVVLNFQEQGSGVILMLDANSTIDDRNFSEFIASCGLNDIHSLHPSPSTYIGSVDRRIDFILAVTQCCHMPFAAEHWHILKVRNQTIAASMLMFRQISLSSLCGTK